MEIGLFIIYETEKSIAYIEVQISLISGENEVMFQGISHSFSKKDMLVHPKILSKSIFFIFGLQIAPN